MIDRSPVVDIISNPTANSLDFKHIILIGIGLVYAAYVPAKKAQQKTYYIEGSRVKDTYC